MRALSSERDEEVKRETKEKDEHRGTENTEGHGEKIKIWMEKAESKTKA